MEIGKGDSFEQAYTVDVQDYQSLKEIGDRGSDVLLCLDSTLTPSLLFASDTQAQPLHVAVWAQEKWAHKTKYSLR